MLPEHLRLRRRPLGPLTEARHPNAMPETPGPAAATPLIKPQTRPPVQDGHPLITVPPLNNPITPAAPARSEATTPGTGGTTIRHLRVAFQDTPPHLRDLEEGWRARRKARLSPLAVLPLPAVTHPWKPGRTPAVSHAHDDTQMPRRPTISAPEAKQGVRFAASSTPSSAEPNDIPAPQRGATKVAGMSSRNGGVVTWSRLRSGERSISAVFPSLPPRSPNHGAASGADRGRPMESVVEPRKRCRRVYSTGPALTAEPFGKQGVHEPSRLTAKTRSDGEERQGKPSARRGNIVSDFDADRPPRPIPTRILIDPLPPTSRPVPLGRQGQAQGQAGDTIHIHIPSRGKYGIVISTRTLRMSVARDGCCMRIQRVPDVDVPPGARLNSDLDLRGRGAGGRREKLRGSEGGGAGAGEGATERSSSEKVLRIDEATEWTAAERRQWKTVQDLVERYKRTVPHIKVYTSLGELTMTCSLPPDVILSYTDRQGLHPMLDPGTAVFSSQGNRSGAAEVPSSSTADADVTDVSKARQVKSSRALHPYPVVRRKVRILLSRLAGEVVIDTAQLTDHPDSDADVDADADKGRTGERYRTRRTVPLGVAPNLGPPTIALGETEGIGRPGQMISVYGGTNSHVNQSETSSQATLLALQRLADIASDPAAEPGAGWSAVEVDALRRLIALKDTWLAHGHSARN